jgi:protein-tyrosine phosphatase
VLRTVSLPSEVLGKLYLHAMPGRYESWASSREAISHKDMHRVVSLASLEEIQQKSPDYAQAIESNDLPWEQVLFPVPDFGVPDDRTGFLSLACSIAAGLQADQRILVHCGAGIGRTGILAICVLMALGMGKEESYQIVRSAGSRPEMPEQDELVDWVAAQL